MTCETRDEDTLKELAFLAGLAVACILIAGGALFIIGWALSQANPYRFRYGFGQCHA